MECGYVERDYAPRSGLENAALRPLLDSFGDAVLIVDERGIVIRANRAAQRLFGIPAQDLVGTDSLLLMVDRESSGFLDYLRATLFAAEDEAMPRISVELMGRPVSGGLIPIEVSSGLVQTADHRVFTLLIRDISERKAEERRLRDGANRDALTGVFSRAHLEQLAEIELFRVSRYGRALSALMLDVDHFKQVNDTHGHGAGDQVLREIARRCRAVMRACDLMGRWGGEEFVLLLPETAIEGARRLGERLLDAISGQRVALEGGRTIAVSVSIGIAAYRAGDAALGHLVQRADEALYRAKASGRCRVEGPLPESHASDVASAA
jgi:two-component system cell cycle response regulator